MRVLILLSSLLLANSAFAGAFDYAFQLYQKQMFDQAREEFELIAKQGDPRGDFMLGLMSEHGRGGAKDYSKAVQFYSQAAEKGAAYAFANLGVLHYYGHGVPRDITKARELYLKGAEKGNPRGQLLLAYTYIEGKGVVQDLKKAYQLMKRAANQGEELAFIEIAKLEEDPKEAYFWAKIAEKRGDGEDKETAQALMNKHAKALNEKDLKRINKKVEDWRAQEEKPDAVMPVSSPIGEIKVDNYHLMSGLLACISPKSDNPLQYPCLRIGKLRIGENANVFKAEPNQVLQQGKIKLNVYALKPAQEVENMPYMIIGERDGKIAVLQITGAPLVADIDFSGLKLGDSSRKILETVGLPMQKAPSPLPNTELWDYTPYGFSFEISQGKLTSIRVTPIGGAKED